MPDLRALLVALGVGIGAATYTTVWWHWPLALGGGIGIVLAGLALVGSVSFGSDPREADVAWREAAPEFIDPPAGPAPAGPKQADAGPADPAPSGQAPAGAGTGRPRPAGHADDA